MVGEEFTTIEKLLIETFSPSRDNLLKWLAQRVNNDLLWLIAEADYKDSVEEHYEALRRIRDRLEIVSPLRWVPKEVLELTSWTIMEDLIRQGAGQTDEHSLYLMKAFASTVLTTERGNADSEGPLNNEADTLLKLVESALKLGEEVIRLTLQLLSWRIITGSTATTRGVDREDRPFFALYILLLAVSLEQPSLDGATLNRLAEWLLLEEKWTRQEVNESLPDFYGPTDKLDWILNIMFSEGHREELRQLVRRLLLQPARPHPFQAEENLKLIGNALG